MKIEKAAVIGLGHFGASLCEHLSLKGIEILAIDIDEDRVQAVEKFADHPIVLDSKQKSALENLGLQELDVVVVAIGEDFESSILTTAHLQTIGVKRIIARTMNSVQERVIELMGVSEQILPERDSAYNLAYKLGIEGCHNFVELDEGYGFLELMVPEKFIGKSLAEIRLREDLNLNLVTLKKYNKLTNKNNIIGIPQRDTIFEEKDILVLFGKSENFNKISKKNYHNN